MNTPLHKIKLPQKPCNVLCLKDQNKFLVGTYELVITGPLDSHKLESLNNRLGKLVIIGGDNELTSYKVEYEYDCTLGGGVFDLKLRYCTDTSTYTIYVAHSNGTIGIYDLNTYCDNEKIVLREHLRAVNPDILLTTIDVFHDDCSLIVGDSQGSISIVDSEKRVETIKIVGGDSIWSVKALRLSFGQDIVIIGAENCSWYMYQVIWSETGLHLIQLYKNSFKDFQAGITSIFTLEQTVADDLNVLLGSYDESMQFYRINFSCQTNEIKVNAKVTQQGKISIPNSGIWRIRLETCRKRRLLVAAMYAGCFTIDLNEDSKFPDNDSLNSLLDIDQLNKDVTDKSLLYDLDVQSPNPSDQTRICCMVDFNNNLCLLKAIN